MYKSLCLRLQRGEYVLEGRDDLWSLLVTITLNKARNLAAHHRRQRRDYRAEAAGPAGGDLSSEDEVLADLEKQAPTPAEAAILAEDLGRRLQALPEELRRIALLKLEGYTNAEIAGERLLDCAERTVERKLNLIRQKWQDLG
jgi:DNA-directed RNA polymerase specialized sigma24 family protein